MTIIRMKNGKYVASQGNIRVVSHDRLFAMTELARILYRTAI